MKVLILLAIAVFVMASDNASQWKSAKGRDMSKYIPKNLLVPPKGIFPHQRGLRQELQKRDMASQEVHDFSDTCGRSITSSRIASGEEAVPHSYPWEAYIFIDEDFHCGGALISTRHVLTAAHCVGRKLEIVLGAHDIENPYEEGRIEITSYQFIQHPNWHPMVGRNDIALVLLPEAVPSVFLKENGTINVACLPTEEPNAGDVVTLTGWGSTSDQTADHTTSSVLHQVDVSIMKNDDCKSHLGNVITSDIVCIDTTEVHGTCKGDYGGPLNKYIEEMPHWEHVGVASIGPWSGCEEGRPLGFTNTFKYKNWISLMTGLKI